MYKKGDIILVPFPFTDLSSSKVRPAVIVSEDNVNGDDIIVVFVSSRQNEHLRKHDILIKKSEKNGLKTDSIIKTGKIATLEKRIILGEIGAMDARLLQEIDTKFRLLFGL